MTLRQLLFLICILVGSLIQAVAFDTLNVVKADGTTDVISLAGGLHIRLDGDELTITGPEATVSYLLGEVKEYRFAESATSSLSTPQSDSELRLRFDGRQLLVSLPAQTDGVISVYNLAGTLVKTAPIPSDSNQAILDLSQLPSAIYILRIGNHAVKFKLP